MVAGASALSAEGVHGACAAVLSDLSFTLTRASHIQALAAADERAAALASEWASLAPLLEAAPAMYPPASWTQRAFGDALAVVLAHAVYLPSARCFALLPLASNVTRRSPGFTGDGGVSATLDYDHGSSAVVLLATSDLVAGQEVVAADAQQRNSAELLLSGCELGGPNGTTAFAGDTLTWTASLLSTDRLYSAKAATLEAAGLLPSEQSFPVCAELGMPTQLLTYLRMSRITDAAELMKVRFDQDGACCLGPLLTVCHACGVFDANHPLCMCHSYHHSHERVRGPAAHDGRLSRAPCCLRWCDVSVSSALPCIRAFRCPLQASSQPLRPISTAHPGGMEDEVKLLQDRTLTREARQAAALRLSEKRILNEVMASVRRRLAPIRGIPTKSGMESANSDLLEIFDTLENLNKKPMEIVREMLGWDESNQPKPKGGGGCS